MMRTLSSPRVQFLHTFRAQVLLALALIGILPLGLVGLTVADRDRRIMEEYSVPGAHGAGTRSGRPT